MAWEELEKSGIKAYYKDDAVFIINADCREVLPELPKVDLVLTDPPYGNNTDYGIYNDTEANLKELVSAVMPSILLICQRAAITCGVNNIQLYPKPKWIMAWIIKAGAGRHPWGFSCWQPILVYGNDPYLANGMGGRADILERTEITDIHNHPCAKPIDFWRMLLLRCSVKNTDVILDPFLGSGTTLRACMDTNRHCIGIEIEEKYCEIAAKRCSQGVFDFR